MDGFFEFLHTLWLASNLIYPVLIAAAWTGILALFMPGSVIAEVLTAVGLLIGIGGLIAGGVHALALALLAASFALYALALWRDFAAAARKPLRAGVFSPWGLAITATAVQVAGGLAVIASQSSAATRLNVITVLIMAGVSLAAYRWLLLPMISALRPAPKAGAEALIGERAVVRRAPDAPGEPGTVILHGELWQAMAEVPLSKGEAVEVIARDGMRLLVQPAPTRQPSEPAA